MYLNFKKEIDRKNNIVYLKIEKNEANMQIIKDTNDLLKLIQHVDL